MCDEDLTNHEDDFGEEKLLDDLYRVRDMNAELNRNFEKTFYE